MKFFRKGAVAAAVVAGALAFAPAAAQAHSSSGSTTYTPRVTTCWIGDTQGTGTQVGLVNLGNLSLSALNNPTIAALGGLASSSHSTSLSCLAN